MMSRQRKLFGALMVATAAISFALTPITSRATGSTSGPKTPPVTAPGKNMSPAATQVPAVAAALHELGLSIATRSVKAADFELLDLQGKPVRLSEYQGSTVLVGFWATW